MRSLALSCALLLLTGPVVPTIAQQPDDGGGLDLELNRLQATEQGCEIALLATSRLASDLDILEIELVLFDGAGVMVDRTLADLAPLDSGRTVLRPFLLPDVPCDEVERVLLNGFTACDETVRDTAGYCALPAVTTSRATADFLY